VRAILAAILVTTACGNGSKSSSAPPSNQAPLRGVVAHRGASAQAPENTLAALRLAWEIGAESAEIDVRVSKDGQVVLMHDADTRRTGGRAAPVANQTLEELRALDVGSWKDPTYKGERIPTLAEAIDATPPGRMLFVEIKTSAADAEVIANAIRAAAPEKRGAVVALQAYDPEALAAVGDRLTGVETYWTVDPPQTADRQVLPYAPDLALAAAERRFTGVAVHHAGVDAAFEDAVRKAGLVLDVWTVNEADQIAHWRRRARWVETDRPELAKR
jgi:glycerophosphoryl diester phosphodiesterase